MPERFSLESGFLASFDLNRKDKTILHDHILSKCPLLLNSMEESVDWHKLKMKDGVQLWENYSSSDEYKVRSCAVIDASFKDCWETLEASKTNLHRSFNKMVYGTSFGDAAVLQHSHLNDNEQIGIKWMAYKCNSRLVYDVDFCVAEYSKLLDDLEIQNVNNQMEESSVSSVIGFKLIESINTKHCPNMMDSHKLERGQFLYGGYVFYKTHWENKTKVVYIASIKQPSMQIRRRANKALLQNLGLALNRIKCAVDANKMTLSLASRNVQWVQDRDRLACCVCIKRFNHFRRKHHCRLCGDIMCKQCSVYKDAELPSLGLMLLRICKSCETPSKLNPRKENEENNQRHTFTVPNRSKHKRAILKKEDTAPQVLSPTVPKKKMALQKFTNNMLLKKDTISVLNPKVTKTHGFDFSFEFSIPMGPKMPGNTTRFPMKNNNEQVIMLDTDAHNRMLMKTPYKDILLVLCELASTTLGCRYAAVTLIDRDEDYLKSTSCTRLLNCPKNLQCCAPVIAAKKPILIHDTHRETQWKKLPIVRGPHKARFYAGAPLVLKNGYVLGAVAVFDAKPKPNVDFRKVRVMENLANLAVLSIEARRKRLMSLQETALDGKLLTDPASLLPENTKDTPEIKLINMLFKASQTQDQVGQTQMKSSLIV